jgi:hypothetical protein
MLKNVPLPDVSGKKKEPPEKAARSSHREASNEWTGATQSPKAGLLPIMERKP